MNREDRIAKFNDLFSPSFGCPTDFEEGDEPLDFVCKDFIKGKYIIDIWFKGEFLFDIDICKSEVYLYDLECLKKLMHSANNRNKKKGHEPLYGSYNKKTRDEFIFALKPFPSKCHYRKTNLIYERFVLPNQVVKQIENLYEVKVPKKYQERFHSAPSIDRIDSGKPYSLGNIRIISWRMNQFKSDMDEEDFISELQIIKNIYS